jgi:hypothetical protein
MSKRGLALSCLAPYSCCLQCVLPIAGLSLSLICMLFNPALNLSTSLCLCISDLTFWRSSEVLWLVIVDCQLCSQGDTARTIFCSSLRTIVTQVLL